MRLNEQVGIFLFSTGGMLLLATDGEWQKWGWLVALLGQPFWTIAAWKSKQWGVGAMVLVYSVIYLYGTYNHLVRP